MSGFRLRFARVWATSREVWKAGEASGEEALDSIHTAEEAEKKGIDVGLDAATDDEDGLFQASLEKGEDLRNPQQQLKKALDFRHGSIDTKENKSCFN